MIACMAYARAAERSAGHGAIPHKKNQEDLP
jgi:hypothetical protein